MVQRIEQMVRRREQMVQRREQMVQRRGQMVQRRESVLWGHGRQGLSHMGYEGSSRTLLR